MKKILSILFVIVIMTLLISASPPIYSIGFNQPSPAKWGDTYSFTATYPKEASIYYGKVKESTSVQPYIVVYCYQSNNLVYTRQSYIKTQETNKDKSITGVTSPETLSSLNWIGGGALCHISFYYFDRSGVYHSLQQTDFSIGE